ncbi:MAG: hypothetical protein SPG93_07330 [Prevotella sp.]|nr:hypothetical protein [Prevotella sp.]
MEIDELFQFFSGCYFFYFNRRHKFGRLNTLTCKSKQNHQHHKIKSPITTLFIICSFRFDWIAWEGTPFEVADGRLERGGLPAFGQEDWQRKMGGELGNDGQGGSGKWANSHCKMGIRPVNDGQTAIEERAVHVV